MSSWRASGSTWVSSGARPACTAFGARSDRRASATGEDAAIPTWQTLCSRSAALIASLRRLIGTLAFHQPRGVYRSDNTSTSAEFPIFAKFPCSRAVGISKVDELEHLRSLQRLLACAVQRERRN